LDYGKFMSAAQRNEHHPLLDGNDFRDELMSLGFHKAVAGTLYNRIAREYISRRKAVPRDAHSVVYREICQDTGSTTDVISLPNLAEHIEEVVAIPDIKGRQADAARALARMFMQQHADAETVVST
jgi:hypothetical protein